MICINSENKIRTHNTNCPPPGVSAALRQEAAQAGQDELRPVRRAEPNLGAARHQHGGHGGGLGQEDRWRRGGGQDICQVGFLNAGILFIEKRYTENALKNLKRKTRALHASRISVQPDDL